MRLIIKCRKVVIDFYSLFSKRINFMVLDLESVSQVDGTFLAFGAPLLTTSAYQIICDCNMPICISLGIQIFLFSDSTYALCKKFTPSSFQHFNLPTIITSCRYIIYDIPGKKSCFFH